MIDFNLILTILLGLVISSVIYSVVDLIVYIAKNKIEDKRNKKKFIVHEWDEVISVTYYSEKDKVYKTIIGNKSNFNSDNGYINLIENTTI